MENYSKEDIQNTIKILISIISRCEKAQLKFKQGTSQHSLLKNRIKALEIAKCLLEESDDISLYTSEEIVQALVPIESIIHKTSKARSKYEEGSTQYKRLTPTIDAMYICKSYIEHKK